MAVRCSARQPIPRGAFVSESAVAELEAEPGSVGVAAGLEVDANGEWGRVLGE
jgi:hypothetical protein